MTDLFLRPLFTWRSAVASRHGPKSPISRHVLLTLSLHMSELGDSCFPSLSLLSEESGLGLRTIKEHIAIAAAGGWIGKRERRLKNSQGWRRNEYFAQIPAEVEAAFHAEQRGAPQAPRLDSAPPAPRQGGAPDDRTWCASQQNMVRQAPLSTSRVLQEGDSRRRGTRIPPDFKITDSVRGWAKREGFEPYLDAHFAYFVLDAQSRSSAKYTDWDKAFMKAITADWGNVRKQAQIAARIAGAGVAVLQRAKLNCAYCQKPSIGNVGGIEHCDAHSLDAMDQKPRVKVAA